MIAIKILNVMKKIGPIIKDKTNEEKGFDYASLAAIIIKAREAMIEEKVIMIPIKTEQIVQRGNDITISMIYRFYDTEPDKSGTCDFMDVNVPGEGCDKEGWAVYKALSGAYKYAITQTFAIPTIDDAEKDKYSSDSENNEDVNTLENDIADDLLNENNVETLLGDPQVEDFENIFSLGNKVG
ncbi:MAG: ERF family protein [Clostridia bacterium]|nr:ERF family protein [Clostridia bacterium]